MKKKNWVVIALCIAIVGMGIGFAALAQNLQINATANITGEWDVRIIDIQLVDAAWTNANASTFDGTSATFETGLASPGAYAYYQIRVENFGNIDAILSSITGLTAVNSTAPLEIQFEVDGVGYNDNWGNVTADKDNNTDFDHPLAAGETVSIGIRVRWVMPESGETTIPDEKSKTATINLNFVQNT